MCWVVLAGEGVGPMMVVGRAVQRADASSPPGSIGQLERG